MNMSFKFFSYKSFFFTHLFFSILLAQSSRVFAEISCDSCQDNFCSSITQIGFVDGSKIYSFDVTLSCSNCSGYTIRIAFDDTRGKKYIKEESISQDGQKSYKIDLQNFYISDGLISVFFEQSSTGTSGYQIVSDFSCQVFYDDYPKVPSGVQAVPRESAFSIRWNEPVDRDIAKFRVYYGFPDSCSSDFVETSTYEITVTTVAGEPIKNGVKYCGFVQAIDNGGKISESSDKFYVIPAKTFRFAEAEEFGCVIANVFGESIITKYLRVFRDVVLKVPGGYSLVRIYYKLSYKILTFWNKFVRKISSNHSFSSRTFVSLIDLLFSPRNLYADDYVVFVGAGITSFNKLGIFQGKNIFKLAYGNRLILADFLVGRKIISFLPFYISVRTNPSILQGRRLIFSDSGEIIRTDEQYSTLILLPVSLGAEIFLRFVEDQIFVPSGGGFLSGNLLFESYPDGSKLGVVLGPSFSFGGNFLLDFLDRRSEAVARSDYGIQDSFVFVRGTIFFVNLVRKKGSFSFRRSNYFDFSSFYLSAGVSFTF